MAQLKSLSIDGNPVVDFIVEQGTSGDWTYRKWNSGIAECWCSSIVSANFSSTSTWGSLYSSGQIGELDFPFTFKDIPTINVTVASATNGGFLGVGGGGNMTSTTKTGSFELFRGGITSITTGINYKLNYYVIGKWK